MSSKEKMAEKNSQKKKSKKKDKEESKDSEKKKKKSKSKKSKNKKSKSKKKKSKSKSKSKKSKKKTSGKNSVKAYFARERVITEDSDQARDLYNRSRFGMIVEDGKVQLSLPEGLFLFEKGKIDVLDDKNNEMTSKEYIKKAKKVEPNFWVRYSVYKDLRERGYIVKTALKFGADFRVYDRGVKPGEDHARWIIYPVHEGSTLTWYEFAAKNRVAHSTKKRLMMGIVDDEGDVTYYEIKWMRP